MDLLSIYIGYRFEKGEVKIRVTSQSTWKGQAAFPKMGDITVLGKKLESHCDKTSVNLGRQQEVKKGRDGKEAPAVQVTCRTLAFTLSDAEPL